MGLNDVTVVIPVGPKAVYKQWLGACLQSIEGQTKPAYEVILVDDMAQLGDQDYGQFFLPLRVVKNDWLLGPYASWNIGVSLSQTNLVLLMGSDDMLDEYCLESVARTYEEIRDEAGFYNLSCQIGDTQEISTAHNNAAVVTKELWKLTGGFPLTANLGAGDALLISIMLVHCSEHLHQVMEGYPLYGVRVHEHQDTRQFAGTFHQQVIDVRNIETERWVPPLWAR